MSSIFLTGFPGFLGSRLVERLLERHPAEVGVQCLVQAAYRSQAERRIAEIEARHPGAGRRIRLLEGDIIQPGLGLEPAVYEALAARTVEIYHLAAVYDLGVRHSLAMAVNFHGTRHVLALARQAQPQLRRFQYVSTCYVSGRYPGVFEETDLAKGQRFNNLYEQSKYLAEVEVQHEMAAGLPVTIYRPGIVTGHSQTGVTQKYDGIYYVLQLLLRQPRIALLPVAGDPTRYETNFVPQDFVIDALAYLSGQESSAGKVYHLCDPDPLLVDEVLDLLAEATERKIVRLPVPGALAKGGLKYIPGARRLIGIEPEAMNYFSQPTHYTCDNTLADLAGTGLGCPPLAGYIKTLVAYMKAHPGVPAQGMG